MRRSPLALYILIAACANPRSSAHPPASPQDPAPHPGASSVATAAPSTTASPAAPTAPVAAPGAPTATAALDALRARGAAHTSPVRFTARPGRPAGQVVFLGTADEAHGAWTVAEGAASAQPVDPWPAAVRVLAGLEHGDELYLLVETLALLEQPAGVRGVLRLGWDGLHHRFRVERLSPDEVLALAGAADPGDLARRAAALPERPAPPPDERACEALRASARTPRALAAQGVARVREYQGAVAALERVVPSAALAGDADVSALVQRVASGGDAGGCGAEGALLARAGDEVRIAGVRTAPPPPAAPARTLPPHVVPANVSADDARSYLQARFAGSARVLGVAPLGPAGATIAVAAVEGPDPLVAVLTEAGHPRTLALGRAAAIEGTRPRDVRFADIDGDGRTDVLVTLEDAPAPARLVAASAYFAPTSLAARELTYDEGSALALMGVRDADAVVRAALFVPVYGVDPASACALITAAHTLAGARRVATPDARVVYFQEPGLPAYRPEVHPLAAITDDAQYRASAHVCAEVSCDARRPVCRARPAEPGPGGDVYWFIGQGASLRLAGVAYYAGS